MDATLTESEGLLRATAQRVAADFAGESVSNLDDFDDVRARMKISILGPLGLDFSLELGSDSSTPDLTNVVTDKSGERRGFVHAYIAR